MISNHKLMVGRLPIQILILCPDDTKVHVYCIRPSLNLMSACFH